MEIKTAMPAWRRRVADLLGDPMIQAVMRSDGLTPDDVVGAMAAAAARVNRRGAEAPAA